VTGPGTIALVTTSLHGLVVAGLTAPVSPAERAAAASPPYPVPSAQQAPMQHLLRELQSLLPSSGDGPLTVTRVRGTPVSYRAEVSALGRPGRFNFSDAVCALLAVGALTDPDVDALAEFLPAYSGIRRQQVVNRLRADDLPGARAAADRIQGGYAWVGYRDIGRALADRGEATAFFAEWKHYAAGKDRNGMTELKRLLVTGVAFRHGWQAALAVTEDKRIGPTYARYAFSAEDLDGLREVLAGDAAGVLSEVDECTLLARAVRAAAGHNPGHDHPLLKEVVDRIIAVDPTTDKAVMRWRDAELFGLWPAYGEQATLDRVRAAVRTPRYRRELTTLARDLGR
jgi:hypothetical protein